MRARAKTPRITVLSQRSFANAEYTKKGKRMRHIRMIQRAAQRRAWSRYAAPPPLQLSIEGQLLRVEFPTRNDVLRGRGVVTRAEPLSLVELVRSFDFDHVQLDTPQGRLHSSGPS